MERKALRFVLGRLVRSAQKIIRGDPAAVGEAVSLVGTVNESMVGGYIVIKCSVVVFRCVVI